MLSRNSNCARIHWVGGVLQKDSARPSRKEMDELLSVLKSKPDVDLQWGDLVVFANTIAYRNDGLTIFDGEKLVDLFPEPDEYGSLPPNFRVLEKHPVTDQVVPITYWHRGDLRDSRFITHNSIVWFDHRKFSKELLSNLTYDETRYNKPALYTWFIHPVDNIPTYIVVNIVDEPEFDYKTTNLSKTGLVRLTKEFVLMLESELLSYFHCSADDDFYKTTDRTLFWRPTSELVDWETFVPDE